MPSSFALRAAASSLLALMNLAPALAATVNVPATHPRLWYGNSARLSQARTYYQTTPFTPSGSDQTRLNQARALRGLMTQNDADCDLAVTYLAGWTVSGNFRDALRQQGDALIQIYDWCHHRLSAPQIATLVARWNGYLDTDNADDFANEGSEANNYFWGRVSNNLAWGIASFNDNPRAQEFIDNALDLRLDTWFADWYGDFGRGGVFVEGGDYGSVMLSYPVIPFVSAADFGYDPYLRTDFFREAIYALIYGTTPGPSASTGGYSGGNVLFPFNDDESFRNGGVINSRTYLGDFARYMGARNPASGNARHMRAWLADTDAGRQWMFDALGGTGNANDLDELPLDYYAPGAKVFDMRTAHDPNSMQVHLQIGTPGGIEHRHRDAGSFQIWREGRWLTRESVGYAEDLAGFAGVGEIDTEHHLAHNGLQFQGRTTARWIGSGPHVIPPGEDRGDQPDGLPEVIRLQHASQYAFLVADFSDAYRNSNGRRVDWPYADIALREFLFIRPLQALLILDRMRASSDSQQSFYGTDAWVERTDPLALRIPAAQVTRTFVMHFETNPTHAGGSASATVGNQIVDLRTLLPATATYRIVDEDAAGDPAAGQYRLELDSSGTAESYFLNVISGLDTGGEAAVTATLTDLGDRWSIALSHPTRGNATVVLMKGMASSGGSIAVGGGAAQPLYGQVQGIQVTPDGPVWEVLPVDRVFEDGFENSP
jgi:hypothetical protein